jgi:tetratricopeptide (TPR) repeat protein
MPALACPDDTKLLAYARGQLARAEADGVLTHVGECEACRLLVAAAAGGAPETIGRFEVEGVAGRGAMGIVYRARDPRLDRPVAVKVIRSEALGPGAHARLEREARALAKIDHPNVVGVYEVGDVDDSVFVAMEYVEGPTLDAWLAESPRAVAEVVSVFAQAGEGLLAAHQAGLVHRDFKPSNVMIDATGRAKVTDFGLVHDGDDAGHARAGAPTDVALTQTGMVLGTPAYMAPEQLDSKPADPRSDQFSLCVALFEALAGHRPFEGADFGSLADAVRGGQPIAPRRPIPRGIHKALRRGLARSPADRFPSMRELVEAVALHGRSRRGRGLAMAGVAAAGAVAAIWLWPRAAGEATTACDDVDTRWSAVWNDGRKARMRAAAAAAWPDAPAPGSGPDVAARWEGIGRVSATVSVDAVRRFGDDWRSRYRDTCTDSDAETSATSRLRRACLVDVLARADALIDVPPDRTWRDAFDEVTAHLDRCSTHLVQSLALPDDEAVADIDRARGLLAEASSLRWRGRLADARARADDAIALGERTGFPPLLAEAWLERGLIDRRGGDSTASIAAHHKAIAYAQQSEHHRVFRSAADNLAWQYLFGANDPVQARRWLETAERLDGKVAPTEYEHVLRLTLRAQLARVDGDLDRAVALMEDALARVDEHDSSPEIAIRTAEGLITLLYHQGNFDAVPARLDALERARGGDPLAMLVIARNRGSLAVFRGDPASAVEHFERAAALATRSEDRAGYLLDAGEALSKLDERAQAEARFDEALAADAGDDIAMRVACARGTHYQRVGDRLAAIEAKRECIRRGEAVRGALDSQVVFEYAQLAYVYYDEGKLDLALDYFERAFERFEQIGRDDDAVNALRYNYAQALYSRDPARARALAEHARAGLAESQPQLAERIESWLAGKKN